MKDNRIIIKINNVVIYVVFAVILLVLLLPLISMFGTAIKTHDAALTTVSLFPEKLADLSFENFGYVMLKVGFGKNMLNSVIVSIAVTLACIFCAAPAGYAISRYHGPYFRVYSVFLLLLQMFPIMLMLMPQYLIFTKLRITNSLLSVIISYTTSNLAFSIWLLKGFYDSIPIELEQAAMVDGCSKFRAYVRVVFPLTLPGIATVSVFTMLNAWNEYTVASVFLKKESAMTMTLGLQKFVQQNGADWPSLMAAACIATIPAILFVLFSQKYLIEGMTAGAVKG
ncbi:carbohydrate ABC transporter permease [Blautia schinkii]|nr:carbohydrate ABC transporter permease [Blautia schinkii]